MFFFVFNFFLQIDIRVYYCGSLEKSIWSNFLWIACISCSTWAPTALQNFIISISISFSMVLDKLCSVRTSGFVFMESNFRALACPRIEPFVDCITLCVIINRELNVHGAIVQCLKEQMKQRHTIFASVTTMVRKFNCKICMYHYRHILGVSLFPLAELRLKFHGLKVGGRAHWLCQFGESLNCR